MSDPLFRLFRAPAEEQKAVAGYWLMSTAPNEVDASALQRSGVGEAVDVSVLAEQLRTTETPTLLVLVHGYNTSEAATRARFETFRQRFAAETFQRPSGPPVFVSYRWPSSSARFANSIFFPLEVFRMPGPVQFMFLLALICLAGGYVLRGSGWGIALLILGGFLTALTAAVAVFRASEYWRDTYRATQYGVPDLVSFFQELDRELKASGMPQGERVRISLLAHSMGAQVVTGLVRILSDVFDNAYQKEQDRSTAAIGEHLQLHRLTLISPDIPAEALLSRRANFLDASLRRFDEAYLFSNQMDTVLWNISTIANSFIFPAKKIYSGYRLGNLAVDRVPGIARAQADTPNIFTELYLGTWFWLWRPRTLAQIQGNVASSPADKATAEKLADRFVYIDATDFAEDGKRPLSRPWFQRKRGYRWWPAHFLHLVVYPFAKPDSHSGYFQNHSLLHYILVTFHRGLIRDEKVEAWAKEHGVRILVGNAVKK